MGQYIQGIVDTVSYFNPIKFIHIQVTKIILSAKIAMLDDTKGSCATDLMVLPLLSCLYRTLYKMIWCLFRKTVVRHL